ncbi:amidase [Bradyrhizobium sp. HKCCYLRH3099]|uniref:amidase n=1 Tax=unclassified Bradyrhizobium TaxID=2631580 RepID=UPI003EBA61D2
MDTPLWRWSATQLAAAIRTKEITSREAVSASLDRIAALNPELNAVVSVQHEAALEAADLADRMVAAGTALGPLHGVPVTTKINVDQRGLPTTNGVIAFKDNIAKDDAPVVANLRRAGAVIIGRTNTPAFSMRWFTDNDLHGRTLNPWRPDRTPGGSSGGAAVAAATGMCAIAHGNDGGGSIRYPAYCTGTVGLRPSFGRVPAFNGTAPSERQLSLQWVSVQGAITRNVEDARLALAAMAAPDPRDPWHVAMPLDGPRIDHPGVAVCLDPAGVGIAPEVEAAVRKAAHILHNAGYEVTWRDPPDVAAAATAWNDFAQGESRVTIAAQVAEHGDALARRAFELMMNRTPELDVGSMIRLTSSRATYLRRWQLFMQDHPLVLCPVAMETALPYGVDVESDASVDRLYRSHVFLFATAFLGLPSISVPTGVHEGIPIGVQIIGPRFREDLVLDAAAAIEHAAAESTPPLAP